VIPMTGPIGLTLTFYMPRPQNHYRVKQCCQYLKKDAPYFHIVRPDVLKMTRAIEDSLSGVVWNDDSQIASEHLLKQYIDHEHSRIGVQIEILKLEDFHLSASANAARATEK
jgi:Holliday junction resolvase RusA-like endonuclease